MYTYRYSTAAGFRWMEITPPDAGVRIMGLPNSPAPEVRTPFAGPLKAQCNAS